MPRPVRRLCGVISEVYWTVALGPWAGALAQYSEWQEPPTQFLASASVQAPPDRIPHDAGAPEGFPTR